MIAMCDASYSWIPKGVSKLILQVSSNPDKEMQEKTNRVARAHNF